MVVIIAFSILWVVILIWEKIQERRSLRRHADFIDDFIAKTSHPGAHAGSTPNYVWPKGKLMFYCDECGTFVSDGAGFECGVCGALLCEHCPCDKHETLNPHDKG